MFLLSPFFLTWLFFLFSVPLWAKIRGMINRFFPFNGGAYTTDSLVCAKSLFGIKPPLKDVWAFNISLLAVRSKRFFHDCALSYNELPYISVVGNMFINDHRDCAAVDFWKFRHLPDGQLVPPSSSEVYKILVENVYLDFFAAFLKTPFLTFFVGVLLFF